MPKNQILTILFAIIIIPLVLAFNGCTANKPERDLLIFPTTTTTAPAVTTTTVVGTTTTTTATSTTLTTTTTTTTTTSITTTTTTTTTTTLPRLENPVLPPSGVSETVFLLIEITNPNSTGNIYYTTDGSTPDESSFLYTIPFIAGTSITVSAIVIEDGYESSDVVIGEYFLRWWKEVGGGVNGTVNAMVFDEDGNLYVGGDFDMAGDVAAENIAMWDGENWHALDEGLNGVVNSLVIGSDENLYAGGIFRGSGIGATDLNGIGRWVPADGWEGLGDGFDGTVNSLAVGEGYLYAGGVFTSSGAITDLNNIARWNISDPAAEWERVGDGFITAVYSVLPITYMDTFLVVAGGFFTRDGHNTIDLRCIAIWNGADWSTVLGGANGFVSALAYDGSRVYVGGGFTEVADPAISANRIASFVPAFDWSSMGEFDDNVKVLTNDDGRIYAGGVFEISGSGADEVEVNHIARWNASTEEWAPFGSGMNGTVNTIVVDSDGNIFAAGGFDRAGGELARNIAVWGIK